MVREGEYTCQELVGQGKYNQNKFHEILKELIKTDVNACTFTKKRNIIFSYW